MSENDIEIKIKEIFSFLFENKYFKIVSLRDFYYFGNWVILLQSPDFRIRIFCDRGEISLAIGPDWLPKDWQAGPWFDLEDVLEFLTMQHYDLRMATKEITINKQLEVLADILRRHIDNIENTFLEQNFSNNQTNLNTIHERNQALIWKNIKRKGRLVD